jgi:hypothetical protein
MDGLVGVVRVRIGCVIRTRATYGNDPTQLGIDLSKLLTLPKMPFFAGKRTEESKKKGVFPESCRTGIE